jgi:hypothetical protein
MQVIDITPVLDTSAYADNDVLFVPIALPTYRAANQTGPARKLVSVVILDEADQAQDIDLIFLNGDATLGTFNGAVNISDADARKILGTVSVLIADYCDTINSQVATKRDINLIMQNPTYIAGVLRSGTPTYTASSLKIKLGFEDA